MINLEGKVIIMNKLKEMGFEEVDKLELFRLYSYRRHKERMVAIRLLSYKEAVQILFHYEEKEK